MKKILCAVFMVMFAAASAFASADWEKEGNFYFLTKKTRDNFSATGAGENKFSSKYLTLEGLDFLVREDNGWGDYGRLNLGGNNLFSLPIRAGMKVEEVHFLSGGNFGNSYKHDPLLNLYGDNYYYAVVTLVFNYAGAAPKALSVPVFWDWFHLGKGEWSKAGSRIKNVGNNPVRKDCSIYHISFINPYPAEPLKEILVIDSWLSDFPFSDIFAVTLKSADMMEATAKENRKFPVLASSASAEPADKRTQWQFNNGLDGWVTGCSDNWGVHAFWQADSYGKKGAVAIPACNWAGDKFSWIEKKVSLPDWEKIQLQFLRHSAVYSGFDKQWSDGLLKITVKGEVVYEKLYSGEWSRENADLSRFKGQALIIRFENHGAGNVRLSQTSSPACDGEDAIITDIRLTR